MCLYFVFLLSLYILFPLHHLPVKSLPGVWTPPGLSAATPSPRGFPRSCVLFRELFGDLKRSPASHLYSGGCVLCAHSSQPFLVLLIQRGNAPTITSTPTCPGECDLCVSESSRFLTKSVTKGPALSALSPSKKPLPFYIIATVNEKNVLRATDLCV